MKKETTAETPTTSPPSETPEAPDPVAALSDNEIFHTEPTEWTPELLAEAKARLAKKVARFRKARGEVEAVDVAAVEKKKKRNKNIDIDKPLKGK